MYKEKISSEYSLKSEVPGRLRFNQTLQTTSAEPHYTVRSSVQKKKKEKKVSYMYKDVLKISQPDTPSNQKYKKKF